MSKATALWLIGLLWASGVAWTIYVYVRGWGEAYTTSMTVVNLVRSCPAIGMGIVLVAFTLFLEALPNENRWVVLLLFVAVLTLGHACWGLH